MVMGAQRIQAVFFDIGDTLGHRDTAGHFHVFAGTASLLATLKSTLGLRLGVITNLAVGMTTVDIRRILADAGILDLLDPQGVVTSVDAHAEKPKPAIYRFAAHQIHLAEAACLYIGENADEVRGAVDPGMAAVLKPFPPPGETI